MKTQNQGRTLTGMGLKIILTVECLVLRVQMLPLECRMNPILMHKKNPLTVWRVGKVWIILAPIMKIVPSHSVMGIYLWIVLMMKQGKFLEWDMEKMDRLEPPLMNLKKPLELKSDWAKAIFLAL